MGDDPLELGAPYFQTNRTWEGFGPMRGLFFGLEILEKHARLRLMGKHTLPICFSGKSGNILGGSYKQPKHHGFLEKKRIPCVFLRLQKFTDSQTADIAPSPPGCRSSSALPVATPGASVQFKVV